MRFEHATAVAAKVAVPLLLRIPGGGAKVAQDGLKRAESVTRQRLATFPPADGADTHTNRIGELLLRHPLPLTRSPDGQTQVARSHGVNHASRLQAAQGAYLYLSAVHGGCG